MRSPAVNPWVHWKPCAVLIGAFFICGLLSAPSTFADAPSTGPVDAQFQSVVDYYQGHWTCDGHFANGKAISSEETFESWSGSPWLHETHDDHPPYSYHAHSVWGVDVKSHSLTLTIHDNFGGVRLFVSHDWSGPTIRFEPQPILGHTGHPERFTFVGQPPAAFSVEYEVSGDDGMWSLGDHVDCRKTAVKTAADERAQGADRSEASAIIANARKILTPNGVERDEKVRIGGIEQWVSIRGRDKRNPVLLVIHGGPGYVLMPESWWMSRDWEEYFTVVHWDQRGSGKTYLINDAAKVAPTMTLARTVSDAEEMTTWLRKEFGKRKIFVLAHSAGTYAGLQLARQHPEWIHAYIGVGQMANMPESERRGWTFAMDAARSSGNTEAVHQLDSIAPYFAPGKPNPLKDLYLQRKWVGYFGGVMAYRHDNDADSDLVKLSPDYSPQELRHIYDGNDFSEKYLLADLAAGDWSTTHVLSCPLLLFEGRHDYNANAAVAAEWFDELQAPAKRFVWFENSAHMPMTEEPAKFLASLLQYARPFAEKVGDVVPEN